jgi:hypothetical protein
MIIFYKINSLQNHEDCFFKNMTDLKLKIPIEVLSILSVE